MMKRIDGTKNPINTLRYLLPLAAVLLVFALVFVAPVAADASTAKEFSPTGEYTNAQALADALGKENATVANGAVKLLQNITLKNSINITGEITIIGDADGKFIYRGEKNFPLFNVTSGGQLTLGDGSTILTIDGQGNVNGLGGTFIGGTDNKYGLIVVNGDSATLTMNDGVTLQNSDVSSTSHNAKPTANNWGENCGAAVQVLRGAEFTMNGGNIIYNNETRCGAVFIRYAEATFTMNSGLIAYNNATGGTAKEGCGGGVFIGETTDQFTMNGGQISYNTAVKYGGGVQNQGIMTISGGEISGNSAPSTTNNGNGGGVYVTSSGTFTMSGGEISDNWANWDGGGLYVYSGTVIFSGGNFTGNYVIKDGNKAEAITLKTRATVSGSFTLADGQRFVMSHATNTITINAPFTGSLKNIDFWGGNANEGDTIFQINDDVDQKADDLLERISIDDTRSKLKLVASGDKDVILAIFGQPTATVEWVNSTIANVTVTLNAYGNDVKIVKVKLIDSQKIEKLVQKDGNKAGSSIEDIQFTGLNPAETYTITVVLENVDVSHAEIGVSVPRSYAISGSFQPPMPDRVKITGTEPLILSYGGNVTLGVNVYDKDNNPLKDEYVTWTVTEGVENVTLNTTDGGVYTTGTATLAIKVNGTVKDSTAKLTATTVHGDVVGELSIKVSDANIKSLIFDPATPIVLGIGEEAKLTAHAIDEDNEKRAGEEITWTVDTGITRTGGDKTGEEATFTTSTADTYTVKATIATNLVCETTITFIGKPTVEDLTVKEYSYVQTATATPFSVTANKPANGNGDLTIRWNKSTDATFYNEGAEFATDKDCTPDTQTVGTFYYRAEVSYVEQGVTTTAYSDIIAVTVVEPTADAIIVDTTPITLSVGGSSKTITATATNSTTQKPVSGLYWTISSETSATIVPNGGTVTITPVAEGVSTVTVHAGSLTKDITVTVLPAANVPKDSGSSSSGSSVWLMETQTPTPTPTVTPTETDTVPTDIPSTQPTATPETPGFGVLAVLAGLGAVAVLRRK